MRSYLLRVFVVQIALSILIPFGAFTAEPFSSSAVHKNIFGQTVELKLWNPNFDKICVLSPYQKQEINDPTQENILKILSFVARSGDLGQKLVKDADLAGAAICADPLNRSNRFAVYLNLLALKGVLGEDSKHVGTSSLIVAAHELRHVFQASRGIVVTGRYSLEEYTRRSFAAEADATAVAMLWAWQMKSEKNISALWRTVLSSRKNGDIALAFEQEMKNSKDIVKATRKAFQQWYKSDARKAHYTKNAKMNYALVLKMEGTPPGTESLPENFFDQMCELSDGINYGCHLTQEILNQDK